MTRWEARILLLLALLGLIAGLTWWLGPLGLVVPCAALLALLLFVVSVEASGAEAVEKPARPGRHPVQPGPVRR